MAKAKKTKKRRKKNYLLRFFVFIVVCVGLYFGLNAAFFDVAEIDVRGNSYYTKEQVISLTDVQTGKNIFFETKTSKLKKQLLEDTYVKNAAVSRKLPGTIVIEIEERKEAAAAQYGSSYIILDADGLVLRQSEIEPTVTVISGLTLKTIEPGTALEVEENYEFSDTLRLIKIMGESDVFFKRVEIAGVRVKAYIYDKLVCIGTPESIISNLNSGGLQKVLYELYNQGVERGTITVGADGSCAFSAAVEE